MASVLDRDHFLLFQLRGMKFEKLHRILVDSDLGQALIDQMADVDFKPEYHSCRYPVPHHVAMKGTDLKSFWQGGEPLLNVDDIPGDSSTSAILIRRGGDFPGFYDQSTSFIDMMELVYDRIVRRNRDLI